MTMRDFSTSRRHRSDLLARPPCGVRTQDERVGAWILDPVDQLEELADLMSRGLLSREEFERHKAKVIGL
jgi:Short C-terminal domain